MDYALSFGDRYRIHWARGPYNRKLRERSWRSERFCLLPNISLFNGRTAWFKKSNHMDYCGACTRLLFLSTVSACLCSSPQTRGIHRASLKRKKNKIASLWKLNVYSTAYGIEKNHTGQVTRFTFIKTITMLSGKVLFLSALVVAISSSGFVTDMC